MTTLTDRYAWAVVRLLPEAQRPEIDRELRGLVDEMLDTRRAANPDEAPADAERKVIAELGDPSRMASRYMDTPRSLIGPHVFPEYLRVLKLIALIAVPTVTSLTLLGKLLEDDPSFWGVVGSTFLAAYGTTVLVAFWVTVIYAFADHWKAESPWTPDSLWADPPTPDDKKGTSVADIVGSLVVTAFTATALIWQQVWPPLDDANGDGVPILDPDIWNGAAQVLLAALAASFVLYLLVLARRRWTMTLAGINAAINVVFLGVIAWLALDERLINDEFLVALTDEARWDTVPTINPWLIILLIGAVEVWDTVEAFIAARRDDRRAVARETERVSDTAHA